jgi:hypothetical protein
MQYEIRRVGMSSALRLLCVIGALALLLPAMCVAGLFVRLVRSAGQTLANMQHLSIALPDAQVGPLTVPLPNVNLDLVDRLGLTQAAYSVQAVASRSTEMFVVATLLLVLFGVLIVAVIGLAFVLLYNLLAPHLGGVKVDLQSTRTDG